MGAVKLVRSPSGDRSGDHAGHAAATSSALNTGSSGAGTEQSGGTNRLRSLVNHYVVRGDQPIERTHVAPRFALRARIDSKLLNETCPSRPMRAIDCALGLSNSPIQLMHDLFLLAATIGTQFHYRPSRVSPQSDCRGGWLIGGSSSGAAWESEAGEGASACGPLASESLHPFAAGMECH